MAVVARGLRWGGSGIRRGGGRVRRRGVGFFTAVRAVMVKELRGRMRGRRAFVVLTVYLLLLGMFAFGVYMFVKQNAANTTINFGQPVPIDPGFGGGIGFPGGITSGSSQIALSASIGHALFSSLVVLETLLVLVLAPAFTTGAISLEREKQTLELLVTTPLSTLGMVIGKLLSALVYVFLLIIASVPFVSIVFPFGGVGPEDLVRAYVVLFALAFGMGAIGLFVSALVRRTQTATVLTFVLVLSLTLGSAAVHAFWLSSSRTAGTVSANGQQLQPAKPGEAPEALLWLNPFVSAADLICTTAPGGYDDTCSYLATVTRKPYFGTDFSQTNSGCPPNARCRFPDGGAMECAGDICKGPVEVPLPMPVPAMPGQGGVDDGVAAMLGGVVLRQIGAIPAGDGPIEVEFVTDVPKVVVERPILMPAAERGVAFANGVAVLNDIGVAAEPVVVDTFGYPRDTFWPHSTIAFVVVGGVLTLLSAQLVAPTRRFRLLHRPSLRWRRARGRASGVGAAAGRGADAGAPSFSAAEPIAASDVSADTNATPITESPA